MQRVVPPVAPGALVFGGALVEIIDRIYVGSDDDFTEAKKRGYTICTCAKDGPNGHRSILKYTSLGAPKDKDYFFVERGKHAACNLIDSDDPNFIPEEVINAALKYIAKHYDAGDKILIHCNAGHSRGPTTALMFLRTIGEFPERFRVAEHKFKTLYKKYDPGIGMNHYARTHWVELGARNEKA